MSFTYLSDQRHMLLILTSLWEQADTGIKACLEAVGLSYLVFLNG